MKLEAVHPHNMVEICPATVVRVFPPYYFLVKTDSYATIETDETESLQLCTSEHSYIFPVGMYNNRLNLLDIIEGQRASPQI
jgi:hypothetical protein